jgi:hypothetical protein
VTPTSRSGARRAIASLVAVATMGALSACGGTAGDDDATSVTTEPDAPTTSAAPPATTSTSPASTTTTAGDAAPPPDIDLPVAIDVSLRILDPAAVGRVVGSVLVSQPTLSEAVADAAAELDDPTDMDALAEGSPAWCSPVSAPDAPLLMRVTPPAVDESSGDVESVELTSPAPLSDVAVDVVVSAVVDGVTVTADGIAVLVDDAGRGTFTATTDDGRVVEGAFRCEPPAPAA